MANDLLNKAWNVRLPPTQKLVLVSLADRANAKTGKCFAGMADHLKRTGLSECSVRRAIHGLREKRQISVQLRTGTSSLYTVHPCQADTPTPVRLTPPEVSRGHHPPVRVTADPCQADTLTIEPSFNRASVPLAGEQRSPALSEEERSKRATQIGKLIADLGNGPAPIPEATDEGKDADQDRL